MTTTPQKNELLDRVREAFPYLESDKLIDFVDFINSELQAQQREYEEEIMNIFATENHQTREVSDKIIKRCVKEALKAQEEKHKKELEEVKFKAFEEGAHTTAVQADEIHKEELQKLRQPKIVLSHPHDKVGISLGFYDEKREGSTSITLPILPEQQKGLTDFINKYNTCVTR